MLGGGTTNGADVTRRIASWGAGAAALTLTAALAGCATGTSVDPGSNGQEVPDGGNEQQILVDAAWLESGRSIGLITEGSSSCVPTTDEVTVTDAGALAVVLADPAEDEPCTRDMAPRITLVAVPDGVDPQDDLTIDVSGPGYEGAVTINGVPGLSPDDADETQLPPTAGWTQQDGQFIILSYGSSTCEPVFEGAETTAESEITVTFADLDETTPCTADLAPRTTLAFADGHRDQPDVDLVLTGGGFDDVTLKIYGANWSPIPPG